MLDRTTRLAIQSQVEKFIEEWGFIFVDFKYKPSRTKDILRFLVDKPGGISLDECAKLNQKLSEVLDKVETLDRSYLLEVCSPGLNRPLENKKDFQRALGREVRLELSNPQEQSLVGTVKEINDWALLLSLKGELKEIQWNRIIRGRMTCKF